MKVIAEIGSNFKTRGDCLSSIDEAKACGADIVKFQYFDNRDLYGEDGERQCLPDLTALADRARLVDIEFACTAFSPAGYQRVNGLVQRHKIASSEITALDILETVESFGKPVILSTGGAGFKQIDRAVEILDSCDVTLLYCVSAYPARIVDFRKLDAMRARYGQKYAYGYSDHSTDILNLPILARDNHGATVIEKHVNFTDHTDTPDAAHALSKQEFALMVKHLRGETTLADTDFENPHQREYRPNSDGKMGFFRPLA